MFSFGKKNLQLPIVSFSAWDFSCVTKFSGGVCQQTAKTGRAGMFIKAIQELNVLVQ